MAVLKWKELVLLAVLLAAGILLGLIGFGVISFNSSGGGGLSIDRLPAEFLKAVYYANASSSALSGIAAGVPPSSLPGDGEALATAKRIEKLLEELEGSETGLGERLVEAGYAYEGLARAAENATRAAKLLRGVLPGFERAARMLEVCNISGFIEAYEPIEGRAVLAEKGLWEASSILGAINASALLSPSHVETYREFNRSVAILVFALDKLEKFYRLAKLSPSLAERLCRVAKQMVKPSPRDIAGAERFLRSLSVNPSSRDCPLASTSIGHSLAEIVLGLKKLVSQQATGHTGSTTSSGVSGSGAGYGEPESDD